LEDSDAQMLPESGESYNIVPESVKLGFVPGIPERPQQFVNLRAFSCAVDS
jgi:hypothetical protein